MHWDKQSSGVTLAVTWGRVAQADSSRKAEATVAELKPAATNAARSGSNFDKRKMDFPVPFWRMALHTCEGYLEGLSPRPLALEGKFPGREKLCEG